MRISLIAIAILTLASLIYANGRHQHQTRHAHDIGTLRFYIDGDELTDATRENITSGTLSQPDFDALKAHFNDNANRHLHKHSHDHNSNHNTVVSQIKFNNIVKNARNQCDLAEMLLPASSLVRQRVENNRHRLNPDHADYATFSYFKGRLTSLNPDGGSLGEMVRDWVVEALQKCIDYESHEDHIGIDGISHNFDYTGSVDMHKYPYNWAVESP